MELEAEDGTTFPITNDSPTNLGRNLGPSSADRTISRRHLSLHLTPNPDSPEPRVSFHVIGKNPIFVLPDSITGTERIYSNSSAGELRAGDKLSLSLKNPKFLVLKKTEHDPAKEFGFLVKGREFDQYPKGMVVDIRRWNWFLEEPRKEDGDDDDGSDTKKARRRKKGEDHGDEEWSGESEEEKVVVVKGGSSKRAKYSTRSKDTKKVRKDVKVRNDEDEDEEDESLGGFIVDEEEVEEEEEEEEDTEEEEEDNDDDDD